MATTVQLLTVRQVAEHFGVHDSRIRQLCIQHDIGTLYANGTARLLTQADLRKLEKIRSGG